MSKLDNGLPQNIPTMQCLKDLLGVNVTVKKADKIVKDPQFWSTFVGDDDHLSVVCAVDLPLGAYMSCALSGTPKNVAEEFIKAKTLETSNAETVREVVNVISSLFNVAGAPHVRLKTFAARGSKEYTDIAAQAVKGRARVDQAVAVDRYGAGSMAFVTFENPVAEAAK